MGKFFKGNKNAGPGSKKRQKTESTRSIQRLEKTVNSLIHYIKKGEKIPDSLFIPEGYEDKHVDLAPYKPISGQIVYLKPEEEEPVEIAPPVRIFPDPIDIRVTVEDVDAAVKIIKNKGFESKTDSRFKVTEDDLNWAVSELKKRNELSK